MSRIAVDASALSGPRDGIGRYLRSLLPTLLQDTRHDWFALGRSSRLPTAIALPDRHAPLRVLGDGLPPQPGRVLSLFSTTPWRLRRLQPDLLWAPAHRFPLAMPRRMARVVTVHDLCWAEAPETMRATTRTLDRLLMPPSLAQADRVIAVSAATRDALLRRFPALAERVVVVHEAAGPLPSPQARETLRPLGIDAPYVLFVGSLEPRKNLARLLEAFAALDEAQRAQSLLVVAGGAGWGGVSPAAMAERLGIAGRLRGLGAVDDPLLATLYRHAHCLAMPSLYEGFGLPVLEALAQGTPALVADGASLPEVAGDAGLVVDPRSVNAIREGLAALLGDEALRARLAGAALDQAARFSWQRAATETLAVFDEAMAVRRAKTAAR